jgi:RimJ/RimL family protein N-acetyltransferase
VVADADWSKNMKELFTGKLVRLSAIDADELSKAFSRWGHDSEFNRLLQTNASGLQSSNSIKQWLEKDLEDPAPGFHVFSIRTLVGDELVGGTDLEVVNWNGRDSFVGIFIGARENWGKGYGTDAMNLVLRYAFMELNLWRVSLGVFEYNPRAIRSYEKAGFQHEGRSRKHLNHEGKRWDIHFMGILRDEFLARNKESLS